MSEYRIRFQRLVSKITTPPSCAPCGADPRSGARPPARQGLAARLQFRFETAAHQLAELEDRRVGEPVVAVQALLAAAHHPVPEQEVEVLGDVRLARARLLDELGHGLLAAPERVEDPEPHGLGEDLEAAGHEFEGLVAEPTPHGSRLHRWIPVSKYNHAGAHDQRRGADGDLERGLEARVRAQPARAWATRWSNRARRWTRRAGSRRTWTRRGLEVGAKVSPAPRR